LVLRFVLGIKAEGEHMDPRPKGARSFSNLSGGESGEEFA
jgi:hypothetical protein